MTLTFQLVLVEVRMNQLAKCLGKGSFTLFSEHTDTQTQDRMLYLD